MSRNATLMNSFVKGVLDPSLSERIDLKHYYQGVADALNLEVLPQGGIRRRAGSTVMSDSYFLSLGYKKRLRRRIEPVNVTAAMITTYHNGTVSNLVDQDLATKFSPDAVNGTTWVLAEVDLGSSQEIAFVDLVGFSCQSGTYNDALAVEYWDGSNWIAMQGAADPEASPRKTLTTADRTRRFGFWPGGDKGVKVSAQSWRVVCYSGIGPGIISISGLRLWKEKRQISPVRVYTFARSTDLVYEMVLTDRNIDVFREQRYQASITVDIDARQIESMNVTQSLDTMMLYHEDVATVQITRQGSNDEWNSAPAAFTNVPNLQPGTAFAGNQDEVQEVVLEGLVLNQSFVLWLGDKVTAPITFTDIDTLAADVGTALNAIGVGSGLSVTIIAGVYPTFRLTFTGNAGGRRWPVAAAVVLGVDTIEPETRILQRGLDASGPIIGETTGYPRCGVFYQERQLIGGFRGAPMTVGFSRFGDEFDFLDNATPLTADLAFFVTLNTDKLEIINEIFVGKHIQIFTDASEWYVETRTLDATQPPNVLVGTRYGMKQSVPVVFANGSTLFVQKGGRVLRDMVFSDVELSYRSDPISLLSPHLLTDIIDVGFRSARSTSEGNQIFMINADGTMAFMSLLKEQEVVAVTLWQTDGKYRAIVGDLLARVWQVVERESVKNGKDLYLEKLDGTHTLDGAVDVSFGSALSSTVTCPDYMEGADVWAWSDDDLAGPFVCTNNTVTLPEPVGKAIVGFFPNLRIRTLNLLENLQNGRPFRPPGRIYEAGLALAGTGQVDIAVNGGPFRNVPLPSSDEKSLDIALYRPRDTSGISKSSSEEQMERLIFSIDMIPGSGEFVYSTDVIDQRWSGGAQNGQLFANPNMHNDTDDPDFLVSLAQARQGLPNLKNVSLFTSWFGDDLRCGTCTLRPKIDQTTGTFAWTPYDWAVAGLDRSTAQQVSLISGNPAFGGTPADKGVVDAIKKMAEAGVAVTFTPFLIMDIPSGNVLPDPYGGASQAVYPWRGRITCDPAPGQPGTVDMTAAAKTQIDAFMGTASVSDFTVSGETVTYTGPVEWSYRRFILHYAHICKAAGGVDTFVIGSEMRGIGTVRDALGSYPFVTALKTLADDVKTVLGSTTKVTYAADWSEYFGHQTGVSGEIYFHLDPLWSSSSIDAIGIDNYWPLSDWRDGDQHADFKSGFRNIYDYRYLQSNIMGGEGYDWFYASTADRNAQVRTPITDGAYGKPWVFRFKDVKGWWENYHYNRPSGVEATTPTGWIPKSKPIWFMETGCPAIEKGANQPNVFYDPKSSESAFPYYSSGQNDDKMQRAYIEAMLSFWTPGQSGFEDTNNPVSDQYNGRMIDHKRLYVYTWDARFYPAYPELLDVWSDGNLWEFGHWITGRLFLSSAGAGDSLPVGLAPELPLRQRLITGIIRVTNLRGWSRYPIIEISQSKPAPLEIRALRYEVKHHG